MTKFRVLATALAAAAFLAACGGSEGGDQSPKIAFTQMVNFGDSLSDVGTYKTPLVAANFGGYYSINGLNAAHNHPAQGLLYTNWTEYVAAQLGLSAPCAAEVGLASVGQLAPLASAVVDSASCYSYAQGGADVTSPVGPGNAYLYTHYGVGSGQLGQLTKPLVSQIQSYLALHTAFTAGQIVTVMAGGNDVLIDRALTVDGTVGAILTSLPTRSAARDTAIATAATNAIAQVTQAATDLATLIKSQIIAHGATHVVVVNLPDLSQTPDNAVWVTSTTGVATEQVHPHLTLDMVNAFNTTLATALSVGPTSTTADPQSTLPEVAWVDAFANNDDQHVHPAAYGLTNVTTPACNLVPTSAIDRTVTGLAVPPVAPNVYIQLPTSLFCTDATLIHDAANATTADPSGTMHYLFADTVHPTPYAYRLLAELVNKELAIKGWL